MSHINVAYESAITSIPSGKTQRAAASSQALKTIALNSAATSKAASAIKSDSLAPIGRQAQRLSSSGPQVSAAPRSGVKRNLTA